MPFVVPNLGEQYLLELLTSTPLASSDDWLLGLYSNDYTILAGSELADITPASYSGYDPFELVRSNWSAAMDVGGRAVVSYTDAPIWFIADSGTQDVYGWYVTDAAETVLLFGERFPGAPLTITTTEGVPITPIMRLFSEFDGA